LAPDKIRCCSQKAYSFQKSQPHSAASGVRLKISRPVCSSDLGDAFEASEFVVVSGFTPASPVATAAHKLIYDPQSGLLYFNNGSLVLTLA
jgi:hypothetical protein